jgi:hypothetical protein
MAKIVSLQDTGRKWQDFFILEVQFDDNITGTTLAKSPTPPYSVGDEVTYTRNAKGGVKIQKENAAYAPTVNNWTPNNNSSGGNRDAQIQRAVAFKAAIDLICHDKIAIADLRKYTDALTLILKVEEAAAEAEKTYEEHFPTDSKDMPF